MAIRSEEMRELAGTLSHTGICFLLRGNVEVLTRQQCSLGKRILKWILKCFLLAETNALLSKYVI